jgi:hypothetical protein
MKKVGAENPWSYFGPNQSIAQVSNEEVRTGTGHLVTSFTELASKVAELNYKNADHVLLFRGQTRDYPVSPSSPASSLKPSIFRLQPSVDDKNVRNLEFHSALSDLEDAERALLIHCNRAKLANIDQLRTYRVLRWTILQHYTICFTPLLDVTSSLRVAASFASYNQAPGEHSFVYVIAVPNISGSVTASAEAGMQIIRLSSVCPPFAARPHLQDGYLVGEYPEYYSLGADDNYDVAPPTDEIDVGSRMVAKFRFDPKTFWNSDTSFPQLPDTALYPGVDADPFLETAEAVHKTLELIRGRGHAAPAPTAPARS